MGFALWGVHHHSNVQLTFTVVTVGSVGPPWCFDAMVHAGWGGVRRHGLHGTVVCVVLVKHVTDVAEEARWGQAFQQSIILVTNIATG